MNNSTRNLKMKKLLIATTALVATAGMASADITITGHAAAGIQSGLSMKDAKAAYVGKKVTAATKTLSTTDATTGVTTKGTITAAVATTNPSVVSDEKAAREALHTAQMNLAAAASSTTAKALADLENEVAMKTQELAIVLSTAKSESYSTDGIYSNAGVDFTMTGATDNGISFSASVNIDAGMEIDTGDFEMDGKDGGTAGLGSVSMTGAFGTLTFDDGGIENLYSDGLSNADVSYATTVGAVSLTVAHDTDAASTGANSVLSSADGVGFIFSSKLPCSKNIQRIASIFVNSAGRICLRAGAEVVRSNMSLQPLKVGDWIWLSVDFNDQISCFKLIPADGGATSSVTFAFGSSLEKLKTTTTIIPDILSGYFACVVKNLGVTVTLSS